MGRGKKLVTRTAQDMLGALPARNGKVEDFVRCWECNEPMSDADAAENALCPACLKKPKEA